MNSLAQQAINAALNCNWTDAIKINLDLLKSNPSDIDSLNRLARAYAETNQITKAKRYAKSALEVDPFNQIAQKALLRWGNTKKANGSHFTEPLASPTTFLEEAGKTRIVALLNLGSSKVIESLNTADEVRISAHSHRVCITTTNGKYLGKLPDDVSARLRTLIKGGNQYTVFIKSIEKDNVKVFIREIKRGKDYNNTPSFPAEKLDYVSYAPPELVSREKPYTESFEEEHL